MLNAMRKNAGSWMIKVLLLAIVIVFIFWGVGSFRDDQGGRVALVDGYTITYEDYQKARFAMLENLKQRFGNDLNEDIIKMLNVNEEALNQLINNRLLSEEAKRLNFGVSKQELADAIKNMEVFHLNGSFDQRRYQQVLGYYRTSPEEFEASQRETMLIGELRTFVESSVKVSDEEIFEWYKWRDAEANIEYALFEPKDYQDIDPSPEDIRKYYEENESSYKTEAMVKVDYLQFDPRLYSEKVSVTQEEITDYYQENPEEFEVPKTVEARHILFRVSPDEQPEIVEEKRKKAEEIMAMAKSGKDFGELARTYSEGPTKANGGYLGEFKKEDMVQPFAEKAFSMETGEVSEPVRTQFGWHIIKVDKINPERRKSFDEAEETIRNKMIDQAAEIMAYDMAETVFDDSFEKEDLALIAEDRGLNLLTTDFFTKDGPASGIINAPEFATAAFKLDDSEISEVLNLGGSYYIMQFIEKMPEKVQALENVTDRVKNAYIRQQSEEAAKQDADNFLARLKSGSDGLNDSNPDKVFKTTGDFKRFGAIPDIGNEKQISEAAFLLSKGNPLPENSLKGTKGYYVIRFKDRKIPDLSGLENEKPGIRKRLLGQKQMKIFNALVTQLRSNSEISVKADFL